VHSRPTNRFDDWVVREWSGSQVREKGYHPYASLLEINLLAVTRDYLARMAWLKTKDGFYMVLNSWFDSMGGFPKLKTVKLWLDPDSVCKMSTGTRSIRGSKGCVSLYLEGGLLFHMIKWYMLCGIKGGLDTNQLWVMVPWSARSRRSQDGHVYWGSQAIHGSGI
jgi:hypothetical protein